MYGLKISIILIFQIFVFSLSGQLFNKKTIKLTRLDVQCLGKNVPVVNYMKGVKCDTTAIYIENSTIVVKENLAKDLKYTVTFRRCLTRENLDSCEEFFKRENGNFCQIINPDNKMLAQSPLAVPYIPKLKCPGKKGVHRAYNFTINLTPFIIVGIDNWYWKLEFSVFSADRRKIITCGNIEGYTVLRSLD